MYEEASSMAKVEADRDPGALWRVGGDQGTIGVHGFEGDGPDLIR